MVLCKRSCQEEYTCEIWKPYLYGYVSHGQCKSFCPHKQRRHQQGHQGYDISSPAICPGSLINYYRLWFLTARFWCTTVYREFFASGNFGENATWKACKIFTESYFLLFQGLSMKKYRRVNISLRLFLSISERSRIQQKLNPREKFPIQWWFINPNQIVRKSR